MESTKNKYSYYSVFESLNRRRANKTKLSNENLDIDYSYNEPPPKQKYTNIVLIDDVLDTEVNYTMLYNAKVGTIVPIRIEDLPNMKDNWIKCDGATYTKDQYPALFELLKDSFYNEFITGDEVPLYTDEFAVPKLDNKKLEDTEVVFMIKAFGREKGNYHLKRDNQT